MRDAFIQTLTKAAEKDSRIVLITGDLGFGVLEKFQRRFPRQFINAGVAEQNMTALACGLALSGRKVFTYSIANFTTLRCLEQIRNDVCYHNADVTIVSIGGGFSYGQLGMSHFATEDLAILRALPELKVVAPTGHWEVVEATKNILRAGGPAYLRLDKDKASSDPLSGEEFILGKARILREGHDVSLVATGAILSQAISAADRLAERGIKCRIVSVHTIKPLDEDTIVSCARETGGIVSIEEHNVLGGLGGAIAETCLERGVPPDFFARIGLRDIFPIVVGDQQFLRRTHGMDAESIAETVFSLLKREIRN